MCVYNHCTPDTLQQKKTIINKQFTHQGQSSSGRQNQAYWTFFQEKYTFLSERELGSGIALPMAVSCRYGLYYDIKTKNNQFRALVDVWGCREANNACF